MSPFQILVHYSAAGVKCDDFCASNTRGKSRHAFCAIAIDQAHEQNNSHVKGAGGTIGLTRIQQPCIDGWYLDLRWHV